jgi:hypothetical protein
MKTKQVKFKDVDGKIYGGVLIDDEYVICGCCGGVFEKDEVKILAVLEWLPISDEILGED